MTLSRIDALLAAQDGLEKVTRRTIEALQLRKLNALLAREKARGGFYRDLPEKLDSLAQLSSLPFTTDEDLALMAHKCAVGVDGAKGSAKLLREEDMLAIFRASR